MAQLLEEARALSDFVDAGLKYVDASRQSVHWSALQTIFATFAELWTSAEMAGDTGALAALQAIRPKLRLMPPKQSPLDLVSMYARGLFTLASLTAGFLPIILGASLRVLHPVLRRLGVPNGWLPADYIYYFWAKSLTASMGVRIRTEGPGLFEAWGPNPVGLVLFNHASNLDPPLLVMILSKIAPKFVAKKVLFKFPVFGWLCMATGMVPIDRGDPNKALPKLNVTAQGIMRNNGRSIALAPEGTRTTDGNLVLPFKKGAFHLQELTKSTILPMMIHGTFALWPPSYLFTKPGEITVKYLPPMPFEGGREKMRMMLQKVFAEAYDPHILARPLTWGGTLENAVVVVLSWAVYTKCWQLVARLLRYTGLGVKGGLALSVPGSAAAALFAEYFL